MSISDNNKSPYIENNYFNQEWISGTLSNVPNKSIYIDEIKNPTDNSEKTYSNILQNYYIYKPRDTESDSILKLSSFYIPNPEIFKILEVFKPLDQGHDFYTSSRNTTANWTLPSNYKFNDNTLNNYNQFQANTSFGGGSNIFGLMCIDEDNYNKLNSSDETQNISNIIKAINDINLSIIDFKGKYGLKLNVNNIEILLLSLYTSDIYNNGMHDLWNFIKPTYVYSISLTNESSYDKLKFQGYLLYKSNCVVPELHISIKNILDEYVKNNSDLSALINVKGNKLYKELTKKVNDKNKLIEEIDKIINKKIYNIDLETGYTLVFTDFKTQDKNDFEYPKKIKDFLIIYLLKYYYSKLNPKITKNYKPVIQSNTELIQNTNNNDLTNISNEIYKIPVSIIDANPSPNESSLIQSLRNLNNDEDLFNYPYKYSIVSINVDGSGLGGQINPSYHPPELSIYMTIFDSNNKFYGFIYRICLLKKINSNVLNSKSSIEVDMHYCFFNINDFQNDILTGENLNNIKKASSLLNNYILKNTKINENNILRTNMPSKEDNQENIGVEKAWYKFTLVSDAPSVLNINMAVKSIDKYIKINRDNIQITQKDKTKRETLVSKFENITNFFSALGTNIYNSITLNAESKDPNGLNNIITTAIKIYWTNGILQQIYPDINNFVRIFLIRNKYIGDNSRATDTLYYNKEAVINPIQMSNDENTLSTAKIVNVSSILASPGSSERYVYIAPYLTSENKYITSKTTEEKEKSELEQLKLKQDSTNTSNKPKGVKRKLDNTIYETRVTRSTSKGGGIATQFQQIIGQIFNEPSLSSSDSTESSSILTTPTISTKDQTTLSPSSSVPSSSVSSVSDDKNITDTDQYKSNLITHLKNISESMNYINSKYIDSYQNEHINDFIIKLYLNNIKENINNFTNGLTIEKIIDIINNYTNQTNPSLDEGLYIKNNYNSIFNDFAKIQSLISFAIDMEEEIDNIETELQEDSINSIQEGGTISKTTFNSINTKIINLFHFTQNRIDILNACLNQQLLRKINDNNSIVLKLYDYLNGYVNDIYSLDICDVNGMSSFIGIYSFFMYFTISFNRQLNNTNEINKAISEKDQNILQQFYSGYQLNDWTNLYFEGTNGTELFDNNDISKYYKDLHDNISILPFDDFTTLNNSNNIEFMLQSINQKLDNKIFEKPERGLQFQIITALKSLYYLLDDNFIVNFMNNSNIDFSGIDAYQFLNILYDNSVYGLIVDNKYKYYINNQELVYYVTELLDIKKGENITSNDLQMQISQSSERGGTLKNKKKNMNKRNKKTINKNKNKNKNNSKKTIKKRNKKKNYVRHKSIKK